MSIPATKAKIKTTDKSKLVVYDYELLVMSPVDCKGSADVWEILPSRTCVMPLTGHVSHILKNIVIGMSHNLDIAIALLSFFNHAHKCAFGMLTIASNCRLHLCAILDVPKKPKKIRE